MANIVLRTAAAAVGATLGAYCAYTAFKNGMNMGSGKDALDGYMIGAAGAAAVVWGWAALPFAKSCESRVTKLGFQLSYVVALAFVIMNAIGYTAEHKTETAGFKAVTITAYDQALGAVGIARDQLKLAQGDPRWAATAGCTNATVDKSKTYCGNVRIITNNIERYEAILNKGRPATADAASEQLSWVTRLPPEVVAKVVPVFWAVVFEVICTFAWLGVFSGQRRRAPAEVQVVEVVREVEVIRLERATDFGPLWEALAEANAALALLAQAEAFRAEWYAGRKVEPVRLVPEVAPVATPLPLPAPVKVPRAKKAKKSACRRVRDANGRYASKTPKLISAQPAPAEKPKLGHVPLNGDEKVVIFGPRRED